MCVLALWCRLWTDENWGTKHAGNCSRCSLSREHIPALLGVVCFSDVLALSGTAFYNAQAKILRLVDRVFDEHIQRQRGYLREDPKRRIKVRKDHIYFIRNADKLYELMDTPFGLKVRSMLYVLVSWCV